MITSIGGTVQPESLCCMVCNPSEFSEGGRLSLKVGKAPPRKITRVALRVLDQAKTDDINACLKRARANYIKIHPSSAILGEQLVCPDSVIESVCGDAKFVSVASDMDRFCLKKDLKPNVIMAAVNTS